ncbi:hypothetical protein Barb6XT_00512 [Bacteroidales bacterium Barb6XT]|nr:hypothetical protein Barb6XT_00512 [Bacteroidales bacterium Barb6XT]
METLQITSKKFFENPATFYDMVYTGTQIDVQKGRKRLFSIIPAQDDEEYFSPELQAKLDKSIQQAEEGKITILEAREDLLSFLEAL